MNELLEHNKRYTHVLNSLLILMLFITLIESSCKLNYNNPLEGIIKGSGMGEEYQYEYSYILKEDNSPWVLIYFHGFGGDSETLFSYQEEFLNKLMDNPNGPVLALGFSYGEGWLVTGQRIKTSINIHIIHKQVWEDICSVLNNFGEVRSYPITLMGFSQGGHNAVQLGLRYSESIERLVLQSPSWIPLSPYASQKEIETYCREAEKNYGSIKSRLLSSIGIEKGTISANIKGYLDMLKAKFYPEEVWLEQDLAVLLERQVICPETYISCGNKDPYSLMEGALYIQNEIAHKGYQVDFHEISGKHIIYDWPSVLDFLLK